MQTVNRVLTSRVELAYMSRTNWSGLVQHSHASGLEPVHVHMCLGSTRFRRNICVTLIHGGWGWGSFMWSPLRCKMRSDTSHHSEAQLELAQDKPPKLNHLPEVVYMSRTAWVDSALNHFSAASKQTFKSRSVKPPYMSRFNMWVRSRL